MYTSTIAGVFVTSMSRILGCNLLCFIQKTCLHLRMSTVLNPHSGSDLQCKCGLDRLDLVKDNDEGQSPHFIIIKSCKCSSVTLNFHAFCYVRNLNTTVVGFFF